MNDMSITTDDATKTPKDEPENPDAAEVTSDEEQSAQDIWDEFEAGDDFDPNDPPSRSSFDDDRHGEEDEFDTQDDPLPDDDATADTTPATPTDDNPPDLAAQNAELLEENRRLRGTVSGQGRKIQSLISERDRLSKSVTASDTDDDAETHQRALDEAKSEYGDIVGPVVDSMTALQAKVGKLTQDARDRVGEIDREIEDLSKAEYEILTNEHPDFAQVYNANREVFGQWIEDQPKALRESFAANAERWVDGAGAARVMTEFKKALAAASDGGEQNPDQGNKASAKRARQLDGARATTTKSRQAATSGIDPNTTDAQAIWDDFERQDAKKAARGDAW